MKKILLLIMLATCWLNVNSQSLSNTQWIVYDNFNTVFYYYHFLNDTVLDSPDNINYSPISTYQTNGNIFKIVDVISGPCASDTGVYSFNISNDTLNFTVINDPCGSRTSVLDVFTWVRLSTGITQADEEKELKIFPNPTTDFIQIELKNQHVGLRYTINDLRGRIVDSGQINQTTERIDLSSLQHGLYYFNIVGSSYMPKKILKN